MANKFLQGSAYNEMVFKTWHSEKRLVGLCTCVKYSCVTTKPCPPDCQELILVKGGWRARRFRWVVSLRNVIVNNFVALIQKFNSNSLESSENNSSN